MPVTIIGNGTFDINSSEASFNTGKTPEAYVYLDYNKGTESELKLSYFVIESDFGDVKFPILDNSLQPVTHSITTSLNGVFKVELPSSAETLVILVELVGANTNQTASITTDGASSIYTATLSAPVSPSSISVTYSISGITYTATDDGQGNVVGADLSGTIDYQTGSLILNFSTPPDAGSITVTYLTGAEGMVNIGVKSASVYE